MDERIKVATGTSGNPIRDGGIRAGIAGALTALLAFVADKAEWLTDADAATSAPVVVAVAFLLAGVWADLAFLSVADQVFDMFFTALFIGSVRAIFSHTF